MFRFLILLFSFGATAPALPGDFSLYWPAPAQPLAFSNAYPTGVITVVTSATVHGPWNFSSNYFTSNSAGFLPAPSPSAAQGMLRLLSVDVSSNAPRTFTNLAEAYGILETIAGRGQFNDDRTSFWQPGFEGGWATNANLSRPHIAFGDPWGNVLIVDQGSHSIVKVTPEGRIFTVAGTHVGGFNGDGPAIGTNLQLNFPNGGWMGSNGTFYILDTENGKVRRLTSDGQMSTLVTTTHMGDGRALWVRSDERLVYFGSGPGVGANVTTLNQWTPTGGVQVVRSNFLNLGNIVGDERTGDLYISDRNAHRVYRFTPAGNLVTIAGNGTTSGGGEGFPAVETGLTLPRSVWFLPNGGFFISEHDPGNRVWYVDPAGIIHRWLHGSSANHFRVGDGQWFYATPTQPKVSRVRSVNTDFFGNLIIVESNYGYVRRIRFQRMQ